MARLVGGKRWSWPQEGTVAVVVAMAVNSRSVLSEGISDMPLCANQEGRAATGLLTNIRRREHSKQAALH